MHSRYKDLVFCCMVLIALALGFIGNRHFHPLDTNFSTLATDAAQGAASLFVSPLKDMVEETPDLSEGYHSLYSTGQNFWLPGLMYTLAFFLCAGAFLFFYKFNNWDEILGLEKILRILLLLVPAFMGIVFGIGGIKYLVYGLFHSIVFIAVFGFLVMIILGVFKDDSARRS
ncbi:hypothetical protein ACFFSY_10410 [Paenibacillus aurantiacus]|uniref:DUF4306 domain-containing protein n=1 Tax=Paenibacillus aurantiacus TaxID=1936118 RepID=A0ABV5KM56_9BACL